VFVGVDRGQRHLGSPRANTERIRREPGEQALGFLGHAHNGAISNLL
jgi:hypothetical protein